MYSNPIFPPLKKRPIARFVVPPAAPLMKVVDCGVTPSMMAVKWLSTALHRHAGVTNMPESNPLMFS